MLVVRARLVSCFVPCLVIVLYSFVCPVCDVLSLAILVVCDVVVLQMLVVLLRLWVWLFLL